MRGKWYSFIGKSVYRVLKGKYEGNKYMLIWERKIWGKGVSNFLESGELYGN